MIVVNRAYHGHTQSVLQISPYKYDHVGGPGKAPHVHEVPCPDTYRGRHRGASAAAQYAGYVKEACVSSLARGTGVAAFFIESGMSVAGVVLPPQGYLKQCYEHVRAAGGVCVADEVQVGFGRFGHHYWGFQQQGIVPAIVTTAAISASFANGLEYFNTFGCCVKAIHHHHGGQDHAVACDWRACGIAPLCPPPSCPCHEERRRELKERAQKEELKEVNGLRWKWRL